MIFYIVRHGVTEWNTLKKVQGAMDIPLAEEGILLARRTGEALRDIPFDICFSSPLKRARQTAELILEPHPEKIPVVEDRRIQEIDFGVLEGSRFKDETGRVINEQMAVFFSGSGTFSETGAWGEHCRHLRTDAGVLAGKDSGSVFAG